MFCTECGATLRDGALFCSSCGAKTASSNSGAQTADISSGQTAEMNIGQVANNAANAVASEATAAAASGFPIKIAAGVAVAALVAVVGGVAAFGMGGGQPANVVKTVNTAPLAAATGNEAAPEQATSTTPQTTNAAPQASSNAAPQTAANTAPQATAKPSVDLTQKVKDFADAWMNQWNYKNGKNVQNPNWGSEKVVSFLAPGSDADAGFADTRRSDAYSNRKDSAYFYPIGAAHHVVNVNILKQEGNAVTFELATFATQNSVDAASWERMNQNGPTTKTFVITFNDQGQVTSLSFAN